MDLIVTPNIADPDGFYDELISAQRDMSEEQAELMIAKLVLLLANHVGDRRVLSTAIRLAAGDAQAHAGAASGFNGADTASGAAPRGGPRAGRARQSIFPHAARL